MQPSYIWFSLAVVLVILEMTSGTFYLLMVALGLIAGGIAQLAGLAFPGQAAIAALVATVAIVLLRRSRFGKTQRNETAARDPNVNLDIGQELDVPAWDANRKARVNYRGAAWDVELSPDSAPSPGRFRIVEVRGSTLVVASH
jgi:membrane protein implicated in regulation of membrane protease activity